MAVKLLYYLTCSYMRKLFVCKPDICDNYVFRIGELHAVFTSLKVLGKLIDGSELDQAFQEVGRIRR